MTEQFEHRATPGKGDAPQPIDWFGHVARWVWLVGLYVVIVSYTFATLGALQFQDRLREIAGDPKTTNTIREQLAFQLIMMTSRHGEVHAGLQDLQRSLVEFKTHLAGLALAFDKAVASNGTQPVKDAERPEIALQIVNGDQTAKLIEELDGRITTIDPDIIHLAGQPTNLSALYAETLLAHLPAFDSEQEQFRWSLYMANMLADVVASDMVRTPLAPLFYIKGFEAIPQQLLVWPEGYLTVLLTLLMGTLGSLLFVTRSVLAWQFKGHGLNEPMPYPFSWFVFRPAFGAIIALAILVLIKAGQLTFSGEGSLSLREGNLNTYLIAFAAIIAGLMSWQTLETIESVGGRWLRSGQRQCLWATGLKNALTVRGRSMQKLADQVGRTERQVERWTLLKDKVTPEFQDRITAALDATSIELFGEELPQLTGRPVLWASKALQQTRVEAAPLAHQLGEKEEAVKAWLAGSKPVPPEAQDAIADQLGLPIAELFEEATPPPPTPPAPAKLDKILVEKEKTGQALSEHLGREVATVEKWLAGEVSVPPDLRARIAAWLGVKETDINWG